MGDECFYLENGKKKDAAIHDEILSGGAIPLASSLRLARAAGLTEAECAAIFSQKLKKAGFDPNEPRDDHGRWVSVGSLHPLEPAPKVLSTFDKSKVESMRRVLRSGKLLEPVEVLPINGEVRRHFKEQTGRDIPASKTHLVMDGHHRLMAHKLEGKSKISVSSKPVWKLSEKRDWKQHISDSA